MIKLTEHFTLNEMSVSFEGARKGLDNTPPITVVPNIARSAELMEAVRKILGHPIHINSCYRSSAINKLVGGKPTSMHLQGMAVDFVCPEFGSPYLICMALQASSISFGKMIYEFDSWIHIEPGSDRKLLTINQHGTFAGVKL